MTAPSYKKEDIIGYECRHVVHCDPKDWGIPDMHFVKEILKDGSRVPRTRKVFDYKRPFWIDREAFVPEHQRTYKQKKERQQLDKLVKYECTQRDLVTQIGRVLKNNQGRSLKQVCRSPYVYGADILSTAIIKKEYQTRFPDMQSLHSVCALDIESDMQDENRKILMCTITMDKRVFTVIDKAYFNGYVASEEVWREKLKEKMDMYLGHVAEKRKLDWEVMFVNRPADVVVEIFRKLHIWKPDILAIWNMDFDVPKMKDELERVNLNPADVFSDPSVPPAYRFYRYKQGSAQKVTASGKMTPVPPEDRWHTAFFPASFYVIDAMCAYRGIRNQKPRAGSYSLDAILTLEIGHGKLKFTEADHLRAADWHIFMQARHPFEYVIYNVYDVVGMLELDEKTMDLAAALPKSAKHSDYQHFRSQPRRLVNDFHYTCLKNGYVIGTTSDEMTIADIDKWVIGMNDWIVALPAFMISEQGMELTTSVDGQMWKLISSIYGQVADLDVSAAYPTNEIVANISQETTWRELGEIDGVTEDVRRAQGINLSGGFSNAVEFSVNMLRVPDFMQLLDAFEGRTVPTVSNLNITQPSEPVYIQPRPEMTDAEADVLAGIKRAEDAVRATFDKRVASGMDPEMAMALMDEEEGPASFDLIRKVISDQYEELFKAQVETEPTE
jgi:hypothetical protein